MTEIDLNRSYLCFLEIKDFLIQNEKEMEIKEQFREGRRKIQTKKPKNYISFLLFAFLSFITFGFLVWFLSFSSFIFIPNLNYRFVS